MNLLNRVSRAFVVGATLLSTKAAIAFEVDSKAYRVAVLVQAAASYFVEQLSRRTGSAVATFGYGTFVLSGNASERFMRLSMTLPEGVRLIPAESCLKMETCAADEHKPFALSSVGSNISVRCVLCIH
jgi:hypothetical protein